jgi:hypothetical protein
MSAVILSPMTNQLMKNATSDGMVIIAPMTEPFRNISLCGSVPVIKIDLPAGLTIHGKRPQICSIRTDCNLISDVGDSGYWQTESISAETRINQNL